MRPSITLLFPLLLTAFFAHADGYAAEAPLAPAPAVVTLASPPPPLAPEVAFASLPAPTVTMASSLPPPVASLPSASASASASAVKMASQPSTPEWTPVRDTNGKAIQQVGQFAVRIYALSKHLDVVFVRVVSGQTQPWNGGYRYQLLIAVRGTGAEAAQYDALVWGIYGTESWQLLSFTPVK